MVMILMPKGAKLEHPQLVATLMEQGSVILKHLHRDEPHPTLRRQEPLLQEFDSALADSILAEELPYPVQRHSADVYPSEQPVGTADKEETAEPDYRELRHLLGYKKVLVVMTRSASGMSPAGCSPTWDAR